MTKHVEIQIKDGMRIETTPANVVPLISHLKATHGMTGLLDKSYEPLVYSSKRQSLTPYLAEAIADEMAAHLGENGLCGCASEDQVRIESFLDEAVHSLAVLDEGAALPPCFDVIFRDDWAHGESLQTVIRQSIALLRPGGVLLLPYSDLYRSAAIQAHHALVLTERGMVRYLNRFFWHMGVVEEVVPMDDADQTRLVRFRKYPEAH